TPPHDPAYMDASATNVWAGSVRVPHGSPWGRPKADRWPDVDTRWARTLPRRTGETRRGRRRRLAEKVVLHFFASSSRPRVNWEAGRKSGLALFRFDQPTRNKPGGRQK